jgi:hypothetical protein
MMRDRFMERGFVCRYGMDDDIAREIGKSSLYHLEYCDVWPIDDECHLEIGSKPVRCQSFSDPNLICCFRTLDDTSLAESTVSHH